MTFERAQNVTPEEFGKLSDLATNGYFTIPMTKEVWAGAFKAGASPLQVGTILPWMEQGWELGTIVWTPAAYSSYPDGIPDAERVVVVDLVGNVKVSKPFGDFSFEEILAFAKDHLWCRPEYQTDLGLSTRFSDEELHTLESLRADGKWTTLLQKATPQFPEALQGRAMALLHIQLLLDGKTRLVTRTYVDLPGELSQLEKIDRATGWRLHGDEDWTVCDLQGKIVAQKPFKKFTNAEIVKHWVGYFWFNTKIE